MDSEDEYDVRPRRRRQGLAKTSRRRRRSGLGAGDDDYLRISLMEKTACLATITTM